MALPQMPETCTSQDRVLENSPLKSEIMKNSVARSSLLLRIGLWLLLAGAVLAAGSLVLESYTYARSMPDRGWNFQPYRIAGLIIANLVFTILLTSIGMLYLWGRLAGSLPDLQGWHLEKPESEFCAADAESGYTLTDYLAQEDRVFEELDSLIARQWAHHLPGAFCRYHVDSVCNPDTVVDRNWNRSLVFDAPDPVGGVLLVHGLSDSPYSLRALGQRLHAEGYTVAWLRVPGHGTCPGALASVSRKDWTSAVKIAMCGLRERLPPGLPLILAGYSNGGALSVHYALSAIEDVALPKVTALVLFSPMIGINPLARITRLYHAVALVSRNRKAQWSSIDAEIDPFRYSSWPMNASVQAWAVTRTVERKLARLEKSGRMYEMPPVLAMQSVVDSTVVVPRLITTLFDRLKAGSNELVLFDINRMDWLGNLFNRSFEQKIVPKLARNDLPYRLTVFRNLQSDSGEVVMQTRAGSDWLEQATGMVWPAEMVSLSHVAVPIPPEDPVYGTREATKRSGLALGSLSMRSEPGALLISESLFMRSRHNPFYRNMESRVVSWLSENVSGPAGKNGET
jgi:alpha-beta hydrolase superfamily lysophospholipase